MTDAHLNQIADLIEAAHFAPDDDAYLAILIDNLLALREGQEKQTALLHSLVEVQGQMLRLAAVSLDQTKPKPISKSRSVRQNETTVAPNSGMRKLKYSQRSMP